MHLRREFKIPEESSVIGLMNDLLDEMDEFENNQELLGNDWENEDRAQELSTDSEDSSDEYDNDLEVNEGEATADADYEIDQSTMDSSTDSVQSLMVESVNKYNDENSSGSVESEASEEEYDTDNENDSMFCSSENDNSESSAENASTKFETMSQDNEDKNTTAKKLSKQGVSDKTKESDNSKYDNCVEGQGKDDSDDIENRLADFDKDDERDETINAMLTSIKKTRLSPPEIKLEDFITDVCFHPERDIIAAATITGDVCLYEYSQQGNKHLRTIEAHGKSCRDVEFSIDGCKLITCSKDRSIMITDMETEKLLKFYENAHDNAINRLHVINYNLFATGDDDGMVKLWDLRTKNEVFGLKEVEDYITDLHTNDSGKLLLVTSGDGYLTTLNIGSRKLFVQSEPYEEELCCMNTFRGDSKLVVGTNKGNLYTFNWGQFGYHSDKFPGIKSPIGHMVAVTDRISCVAGEDGVIMAVHVAPFRLLGVVGQHEMAIEGLDINWNGELIASCSHNNEIRFWNVKYFENFYDIKYNEKHNQHKEKSHNLPSSKYSNAGDFFADLN